MEIGAGRQTTAVLTLIVTMGVQHTPVFAQETGGQAFTIEGSIRSTVEVDDNGGLSINSPGTDLTFGTAIDLTATLESPRSQLAFSLGGVLQAEDLAAGRADNGFVDPSARLEYQLEGVNSLLTASADYSSQDVANSFSDDTDGDLIDDLFLSSIGEIERYGADFGLSVGREGPFGVDLDLSWEERDFSNTVNPDLFDSTTITARITGRFSPAETVTGRLYVEERDYEADDMVMTHRTTRTMGVGLDYEINPVLTFSGEIGATEVDEMTTVMGMPVRTVSDGVTFDASLTQEMRNGSTSLSAKQELGTGLRRSEVTISRLMDLPSGSLEVTAGVSDGDRGETVVIGSVDYVHEFPGAVLGLSAERDARVNSDNDQFVTNRYGLTYERDLTPTAGISLGLDVVDIEDIGTGGASEGTRSDLSITYRQELTEDWDWSLGYVGRQTKDATGAKATSNAVVFSVGRSFSLRP